MRRDGGGRLGAAAAALIAAALLAEAAAAAEQATVDESVFGRTRPEYDPTCIDTAAFGEGGGTGGALLCPTLDLGVGYDDNVFRTDGGTEDDLFTRLRPAIALQVPGETSSAQVQVEGDVRRYADLTTNDSEDFRVQLSAGASPWEGVAFFVDGFWGRFHESRDDPDSPGGAQNVNEFYLLEETLGLSYQPSELFLGLRGRLQRYNYLDNGPIGNDDRDRNTYRATARAGYNVNPDILVFVEPSYEIRRYDFERDSLGLKRDSDIFDARAGLEYDFSGITYLELTAGYFASEREDPTLTDGSGLAFGGRMVWNPTGLTTVNVELNRSIQESTLPGVSEVVYSALAVGLDYEMRYNLLFGSTVRFSNSDFQGNGRDDQTVTARVGFEYLLSEYLTAQATYRFERRASNAAGEEFLSNIVIFTIRGQL